MGAMDDHACPFCRVQSALTIATRQNPVCDLTDLGFQMQQRGSIQHELAALEQALHQYKHQFEHLPALPDVTCMRWAQQVLDFAYGRLLVVDTVFPGEDAVLIQILLVDLAGQVRFSHCVTPGYTLSSTEIARLGINAQEWREAAPLPQLWLALREALRGCYLLADHVRHTQALFDQEAQRLGLDPLLLIGDSLLPWYARFYRASGVIGLPSLCHLIGHSLPAVPTVRERAQGHLALLHAMARGITCVHPADVIEQSQQNVPLAQHMQ